MALYGPGNPVPENKGTKKDKSNDRYNNTKFR